MGRQVVIKLGEHALTSLTFDDFNRNNAQRGLLAAQVEFGGASISADARYTQLLTVSKLIVV